MTNQHQTYFSFCNGIDPSWHSNNVETELKSERTAYVSLAMQITFMRNDSGGESWANIAWTEFAAHDEGEDHLVARFGEVCAYLAVCNRIQITWVLCLHCWVHVPLLPYFCYFWNNVHDNSNASSKANKFTTPQKCCWWQSLHEQFLLSLRWPTDCISNKEKLIRVISAIYRDLSDIVSVRCDVDGTCNKWPVVLFS